MRSEGTYTNRTHALPSSRRPLDSANDWTARVKRELVQLTIQMRAVKEQSVSSTRLNRDNVAVSSTSIAPESPMKILAGRQL